MRLLFTLSVATLVFGLASANVELIRPRPQTAALGRWIAAYMLLVALCMAGLHLSMAVNYLLRGRLPGIIVTVNYPTNVIAALDLCLVVPLNLLGAWWLWRGRRWGIVLAAIANV